MLNHVPHDASRWRLSNCEECSEHSKVVVPSTLVLAIFLEIIFVCVCVFLNHSRHKCLLYVLSRVCFLIVRLNGRQRTPRLFLRASRKRARPLPQSGTSPSSYWSPLLSLPGAVKTQWQQTCDIQEPPRPSPFTPNAGVSSGVIDPR